MTLWVGRDVDTRRRDEAKLQVAFTVVFSKSSNISTMNSSPPRAIAFSSLSDHIGRLGCTP